MQIRNAQQSDLNDISEVHTRCFPNSFSTQLGRVLIEKFYIEYMKKNPDLFIVGVENKKIVGFCMGYICEYNDFFRLFVKHNLVRVGFRVLLLLFTGNKLMYVKIKKIFSKKEVLTVVDEKSDRVPLDERGDLLSLCVIDEYRGTGLAQKMIEKYEEILKKKECKICILSVASNNSRAIKFYEKNGYRIYRKANTFKTYTKNIN